MGKNKAGEKVSAYMSSLKAGYKIDPEWGVGLGTGYLSGDPDSKKVATSDPLYGIHCKSYGGMDYFYTSAYNKSLQDETLSAGFRPTQKIGFSLNYHHFSTIYDVTAIDGKEGRSLGLEFSLQVGCVLMKDVRPTAGYSTMLGTKYMDIVKGGSRKSWQDWGWLTLNINLRILFTRRQDWYGRKCYLCQKDEHCGRSRAYRRVSKDFVTDIFT